MWRIIYCCSVSYYVVRAAKREHGGAGKRLRASGLRATLTLSGIICLARLIRAPRQSLLQAARCP